VSSYAGGTGEALPWGLVLVEGIIVALFGLVLLVAPGASLVFLVWLLGIYLLIAGVFRIVGIFLDASNWGWKRMAVGNGAPLPTEESEPADAAIVAPCSGSFTLRSRAIFGSESAHSGPGRRLPRLTPMLTPTDPTIVRPRSTDSRNART
jgi:hypothetical protein